MNRRSFLRRVGLLAATPVVAKVVPEVEGLAALEGEIVEVVVPAYPSITFTGDCDNGFVMNDSENTISFYFAGDDANCFSSSPDILPDTTTGASNAPTKTIETEDSIHLPPTWQKSPDVPTEKPED